MKVVVLAGGTSTERDVSLVTGIMIYKALKKNGHRTSIVEVGNLVLKRIFRVTTSSISLSKRPANNERMYSNQAKKGG